MTTVDDIRALGVGAPLRAAYEASKRLGGHAMLFGALARRPAPSPPMHLPWAPSSVPADVATRTLDRASAIAAGDIEIFGRIVRVGSTPEWSAWLEGDGHWPTLPWWRLDIRSDDRAADVKWAWELGRLRHVVVLARACRLRPDDDHFRNALVAHLSSFLDENPAEMGVHWYSNLELALRAWAMLQIVSLAEAAMPSSLVDNVSSYLWRIGRHLLLDVPYTVSTMRNNHLLGDGVGMCVVGHAFARHRFGRALTRVGNVLIDRFVRHGSRPDGSSIEDSLSYHRFVLELLVVRAGLGGATPALHAALQRGGELLARLGVFSGEVPQYGDWDEGRALVTAGDARDIRGSAAAALAMIDGAPAEWRGAHDEVAWYVRSDGEPTLPTVTTDGSSVGGGLARSEVAEFVSYLKTAAGHSHNHADAGSTYVDVCGLAVIADPGTGSYNADLAQRTYFRTSLAHPLLRIDGTDELEPIRVFRWRYHNRGAIGEPIRTADGGIVSWCWHDSYERLQPGVTVVRAAVTTARGVYVSDWTDREAKGEVSLPLAAGVDYDSARQVLRVGDRDFALDTPDGVEVSATTGRHGPFDGWMSATYGTMAPATRLSWRAGDASPALWCVRRPDALRAEVVDGWWCVDDARIRVSFSRDEVVLDVRDDATSATRRMRR